MTMQPCGKSTRRRFVLGKVQPICDFVILGCNTRAFQPSLLHFGIWLFFAFPHIGCGLQASFLRTQPTRSRIEAKHSFHFFIWIFFKFPHAGCGLQANFLRPQPTRSPIQAIGNVLFCNTAQGVLGRQPGTSLGWCGGGLVSCVCACLLDAHLCLLI